MTRCEKMHIGAKLALQHTVLCVYSFPQISECLPTVLVISLAKSPMSIHILVSVCTEGIKQ